MHLIVGSSGLIGRALCERLGASASAFAATSRTTADTRWPLDLAAEPDEWRLPDEIDVAFLCAAETSLQKCEQAPERTRRINVERTVELAHRLVARGAFVVHLSTNLVFDGSQVVFRPDDPVKPVTEYGRQKAEAEAALLDLHRPLAVVRLTKVVHAGMPLLRDWGQALRGGETVRAFTNLRFSPLSPAFVAEALCAIAAHRLTGTTQLSGSGQISYADLALALARRLGAAESLVIPTEAPDGPARSAALEAERATRELGLPPPDVAQTVGELLDSLA